MKYNFAQKHRHYLVIMVASLLLTFSVQAQKTQEISEPLTPKGEINLWTFADKVILPSGSKDIEKTLQEDLVPNEANLAPMGGDKLNVANRDYKWGVVKLIDGYYGLVNDEADAGKPLDYSAAYLYCVLNSETAQDVNMILRSDDSPKVYLNGKLAFSKFCQRGIWQEKDTFPLSLKKGENKLLIRVDNYLGGAGFYCRLVNKQNEPVKGVTASVTANQKVKVWDYKNSLEFNHAYQSIPPLLEEPFESLFGSRIQRTMTLLETSTKTRRNKVKILFYGQSIVAEGWHRLIVKQLKERYPYAIIECENRAIGGHTAPVLVRCASQDLYPFYPDLVVFHVYNGVKTGELERIFYNIRKFTTAEILTFSHHFCRKPRESDTDESQYYKYLAQKYDCEFVNVHEEWGRYLKKYKLEPGQLLTDGIHHNGFGFLVLQKMIMKHFKFNTLYKCGWFNTIKTYEARRFFEEKEDEIQFSGDSWKSRGHGWGVTGNAKGNSLKLDFTGNRIDIIIPQRNDKKPFGTAKVLIDGKAPSEFPSVYVATRPSLDIFKHRPAIKRVTLGKNAVEEAWTFRITEVSDGCKDYKYEVIGSVTGHDGYGTKNKPFVSKSGRIRLSPRDLAPFRHKRKKLDNMIGFEVKWQVKAMCQDTWKPQPSTDTAIVNSTTLVQGLPNTKHTLELILNGDGQVPVKAIKVYSPAMK